MKRPNIHNYPEILEIKTYLKEREQFFAEAPGWWLKPFGADPNSGEVADNQNYSVRPSRA